MSKILRDLHGVGGVGGGVGYGAGGVRGRDAHSRPVVDARLSCAVKVGVSAAVVEMQQIVRDALIAADRAGSCRKQIAARLGVSISTINAWLAPSRELVVPQGKVAELIFTRGVLPEAVRRRMFAAMAAAAGFAVVEDVGADPSHLTDQALEVAAAAGHVAEVVGASCSASSPAGKSLTGEEREAVLEALGEAEKQLREMHVRVAEGV